LVVKKEREGLGRKPRRRGGRRTPRVSGHIFSPEVSYIKWLTISTLMLSFLSQVTICQWKKEVDY
jgi:hypothetical protein